MKNSRSDAVRHVKKQLSRLGFTNVVDAKRAGDCGVAVTSDHFMAQIGLGPAPVDASEIAALHEATKACGKQGAYYSASGYTRDAEERAKVDGTALFDLGPSGRIRPGNRIAKQLVRRKHSPELSAQTAGVSSRTAARDREPEGDPVGEEATPKTGKERQSSKWFTTQMSTAMINAIVGVLVTSILTGGGIALYRHLAAGAWTSSDRGSMTISREGYRLRGMAWPFTADSGVLTCQEHQTVTFATDDSTFALMPVQDGDRTRADEEGWRIADGILDHESNFVVIGLSNVLADGRQLC